MDPHPAKASLQAGDEEDFAALHPLRPLLRAGVVTLGAYGVGCGAVAVLTLGRVPPGLRLAWIAAAALFLAAWAALVVVMWWRRPDARETVLVWGHASRFITYVSQALVAAAIWGFFPFCPPTERLLMAGMFLQCAPAQMVAAPENVTANRLGILASAGSLVAWFALHGQGIERVMAVFAAGLGGMFLVLGAHVPAMVAQVVEARQQAEAARSALAVALQTVAAERDAKTRFLAAASHDLGQPLQAARLFFDQVLRTPDPVQGAAAADGVRRAFAAADQMIDHMLSHLRLEADAVTVHLAEVPLGPLLARVAAQFGPEAEEEGAGIVVLPSSLVLALDRMLAERALANILANAIRHGHASRILLAARRQGDEVRLWVIDNGRGVPEADRARIFDDYTRGDADPGAAKGGFGIGLASVRRIARLMGGRAGLDPRWRHGAAFYLEFPLGSERKGR